MATLLDRFLDKVSPEPNTGCWLWIAATVVSKKPSGVLEYGSIWAGERTETGNTKPSLAHRVAYVLFKGPIPSGLDIDHLCRVTICVNPQHLEAVTSAVNSSRAPTCIATINAKKTHCPAGHEYTARNTHVDPTGARHCRTCDLNRHNAIYRAARQ